MADATSQDDDAGEPVTDTEDPSEDATDEITVPTEDGPEEAGGDTVDTGDPTERGDRETATTTSTSPQEAA